MYSRDPPILRASLASLFPPVISLAARSAHRISGTLRCLQRLRPDWIGNILTKDCVDYIGKMGSCDEKENVYRLEDTITLRFFVRIHRMVPPHDLTALGWTHFDDVAIEPLATTFSVSFYWRPTDKGNEEEEYYQLAQQMMSLIPESLLHEREHVVDFDINEPEYWGDFDEAVFTNSDLCTTVCVSTIGRKRPVTFNISMWVGQQYPKQRKNVC